MRKPRLTANRLREVLNYDPEAGIFVWLRNQDRWVGKRAGCLNTIGYRVISVDCRKYYAGRLAWLYVNGEWPPNTIDHIDRNRANDKIDNLRPATQSQNMANTGASPNNTSGVKGVGMCNATKRWRAQIHIGGKCINLGRYIEKSEAAKVRQLAEVKYFGEFAGR